MVQPVIMPKLGQSVEECTMVKWRKHAGDKVNKGDILFETETEKAVLEVESFYTGTLLKIVVAEGQTVPINATVAFIGEPGEAIPAVPPPPPPPTPEPAAKAPPPPLRAPAMGPAPAPTAVPAAPPPAAPPPAGPSARLRISPRARALARHSAVDPAKIRGSGPGGRIVERDLRAHLEAHHYGDLRVTPAARQLARLERVDILDVRGTGEGGRITVRDVERAVAERPRPLSRMRQTIAQRLVHSVTTAPHFFVTVEVDMSALWAVRKELRERGGVQYSVTDYVLMAVVRALREHPVVNSVTDGRTFTLRSAVHLGMATSIEDGLVVPVIRDAGGLTLAELHDAAAALAARAREGKLKPDAMSGSTFTVSNMGMLSVENFTAIINPGESAILAVSSTLDKPVVRQGRVEVRPIMKITLSADHRLVDGALAAAFVNTVRQTLEDETLWRSMTLS